MLAVISVHESWAPSHVDISMHQSILGYVRSEHVCPRQIVVWAYACDVRTWLVLSGFLYWTIRSMHSVMCPALWEFCLLVDWIALAGIESSGFLTTHSYVYEYPVAPESNKALMDTWVVAVYQY